MCPGASLPWGVESVPRLRASLETGVGWNRPLAGANLCSVRNIKLAPAIGRFRRGFQSCKKMFRTEQKTGTPLRPDFQRRFSGGLHLLVEFAEEFVHHFFRGGFDQPRTDGGDHTADLGVGFAV